MKPGVITTEFWTTQAVNLVALLNAAGVWNLMPKQYSVAVMGIVTGLYSLSRGWAKSSGKPQRKLGKPKLPKVTVTGGGQ